MSAHITLTALLERNPGKELVVDADRPISVLCAGVPWICTAVLDRTAILVSGSDPNDRHPVRHENLMVDPAGVQWRELASSGRFNGHARYTAKGRQETRDKTDDEARKSQRAVAAAKERELAEQRRRADEDAAKRQAELPEAGSVFGALRILRDEDSILTVVREAIDTRRVGICAKCGRSGRLSDAGVCQRHQPRKSRPRDASPAGVPSVMPSRTPPVGDGSEEWHGTAGGYKNHSCRCEPCRKAQADSQHLYRERERLRLAGTGIEPPAAGSEPSPAVAISHSPPDAAPATKTHIGAFTELLNDLRQLSTYAAGLEQDNTRLRTENEQLRDEKAGLYDELHAIVGGIKKATAKGGR